MANNAYPTPGMGTIAPALDHVEAWLFDLDNTLYPASCNLFAQVDLRITQFLANHFGIPLPEARVRQKAFWRSHGTTMNGLMAEAGIAPTVFLDYVHAIDLSPLAPDPKLDQALARLPGRKLIYTNASVHHAERVLHRLGIDRHFTAIHDIEAAAFRPKPDPRPYEDMARRYGLAPDATCMVEDMARNLLPAAQLGWTTVWLRSTDAWSQPDPQSPSCIDHAIDDLSVWLDAVTGAGA